MTANVVGQLERGGHVAELILTQRWLKICQSYCVFEEIYVEISSTTR